MRQKMGVQKMFLHNAIWGPPENRHTIYGSIPNCLLYTYNQNIFCYSKRLRTNMIKKLHFWGGKNFANFANFSTFDPMEISRSNFLQLIHVARSIWSQKPLKVLKKTDLWGRYRQFSKAWSNHGLAKLQLVIASDRVHCIM